MKENMHILIEYLLFVGAGLYLATAIIFFLLFLRTLRTRDGIGLVFLKILTFSLFLGSMVIFTVRVLTGWFDLDIDLGTAIACINPLLLAGVGLYLNYLFYHPTKILNKNNTKDIKIIKKDVKIIKNEVMK